MKRKSILAALAVALVALAQPALAEFTQNEKGEVTHYNGIELPPIQTIEEAKAQAQKEIAAAKKAREAQQAEQPATRHSSPATPPQEFFYTGKPFLEESGQYLFLFRHYDPELGRWTTADPSGFPDGANNVAYMAVPTCEFDWQGLSRQSLGKPPLPTSIGWDVGDVLGDAQYNDEQGVQYRLKLDYTSWVTTPTGGVGNTGAAFTFTGSVSISQTTTFGANYGFSNLITFGGTYMSAQGSALTAAASESKSATPGVSWEARLLIPTANLIVESRRMINLGDSSNPIWTPMENSYGLWSSTGLGKNGVYRAVAGIEWL